MTIAQIMRPALVAGLAVALAACTAGADEPAASPEAGEASEAAAPAEEQDGPQNVRGAPTPEPTSPAEEEAIDALLAFEPALDGMFWYFDNDLEYQVMRGSTFFPPGSFLVDPPACAPIVESQWLLTAEDQGEWADDLVVDLGSLLPDGADPEASWEELDPLAYANLTVRTMTSDEAASALVEAPLGVTGCEEFLIGVEAAEDPVSGVEVSQVSLGDIDGVTRIREDYSGFDDDPDHEAVAYLYAADDYVVKVRTDGFDDPDAAAATLIGDLLDHLDRR